MPERMPFAERRTHLKVSGIEYIDSRRETKSTEFFALQCLDAANERGEFKEVRFDRGRRESGCIKEVVFFSMGPSRTVKIRFPWAEYLAAGRPKEIIEESGYLNERQNKV